MKAKQVKPGFSREYSLYHSISKPDLYFALSDDEVDKLTKIQYQYQFVNESIPDDMTVTVLMMGQVDLMGTYDIIDGDPVSHRINDLISDGVESNLKPS